MVTLRNCEEKIKRRNVMKYRVAECLNTWYDGSKHRQKYAFLEDGSKKAINEDKEGHEFFYVSNKIGKPFMGEDCTSRSFFDDLFDGRIKDAIDTIKNGEAHCLYGCTAPMNVFQSEPAPIYMLDEKLGAEFREKTLDGFKDAIFGYGVKFGCKNSFGPARFLNKEGKTCLFSEDKPAFFETEQDAYNFMQGFVDTAKKEALNIINGENASEVNERNKAVQGILIFDLLKELKNAEGNYTGKYEYVNEKHDFENYYIKIVQMIKPETKE